MFILDAISVTSAVDTFMLDASGQPIAFDARGYLVDPSQWSEILAEAMAQRDGVQLGTEHWRILRWLRSYYERHGRSPAMRVLVKEAAAELGTAHADSRQLYRLFPQGPAKQAARYAGLPKPTSCI